MNRNFVMRAAICMVALMCALLVLESQAEAKLFGGRHRGGGCGEEASCGCPVEETSCGCPVEEEPSCGAPVEESCAAPEPSCGCPVVEESCGCPAEPSCGCSNGHGGRKHRLFGGRRNRGGGCESSCGCAVEVSCGEPIDAGTMEGEAPPAPEAPAT